MPLLRMRDTRSLSGDVITCQALVNAGVDTGEGKKKDVDNEERSHESEEEKGGGSKDGNIKADTSSRNETCKRYGDAGHKTVNKCPDY